MRNRTLLNEAEIYLSILSEKPDQPVENTSQDKILLDDVLLPIFQINDFLNLKKEIKKSENPIEVVRKYKINYQYEEAKLNTIINNPILSFQSKKKLMNIILHSFLGWQIQNTDKKDPPVLLFSSLALICDPEVFGAFDELMLTAISAFYHLFSQTFMKKKSELGEFLSPLFLFLSQNRNLPERCYDLLLLGMPSGLLASSPNEIPREFQEILTFSASLELPSQVASELLQAIIYQISNMNIAALQAMKGLLPMVKETESLSHLIELISMSLLNYVNENNNDLKIEKSGENIVKIGNDQSSEGQLSFSDHDPFPNGLDFETIIDLSDTISLKNILGEETSHVISLIYYALEDAHELIDMMISYYGSCLSMSRDAERLPALYAAIYEFCSLIDNFGIYSNSANFLLNDTIFDPELTCFDKKEGWDKINSLRNAAMKLSTQIDVNYLNDFFKKIKFYPRLFSETVHRLIAFGEGTYISAIISSSLIQAALFYRPIQIETNDVEFALTSILMFIYTFFQQQHIASACFEDPYFSQSFLAFLFEPKARPFVLKEVRNYVVSVKSEEKNLQIIPQITNIIGIACTDLTDNSIQLVSDALFAINEIIIHKWNYTKSFACLLSTFFNACTNLTKSKITMVFIDNMLSFMALISTTHTLTGPELNATELILRTIYSKDPPITVFYKLIQVAASTTLGSQSTSIKIQQPKVLRTILSIFEESSHFSEVIQFIGGCCNYSYKNCVVCHNAEIDNLLINLLKKGHNTEAAPVIFDTFNRISTVVSSVSVMQRYISLFCPEDGKITSTHVNALKAISQNLYISRRMPPVSMPFSNNSIVIIKNLSSEVIADGFAFSIWIYHEPNGAQYKPLLLLLSEGPDKFISISCSTSQLVINHQSDDYDTVATIDISIPPCQWALITLEYGHDERTNGSYMAASSNCQEAKRITLPQFIWRKKIIYCQVGGLAQDSIKPSFASRFGQFQFLRSITEQHLIAIYEAGPRIDPAHCEETIVSARTVLKRNELAIEKIETRFDTSMNYTYGDKETMVSLSEIIGHMCKVEFLLPLFSLLDYPLVGCDAATRYPDLVIDVFSNTLSMSQYSQQLFCEASGFQIISHLLLKCSAKFITYQLYIHFFSMLEVITEPKLQSQLLDSIILNSFLWYRADAANHLKIIKHWTRVVYPSYTSQFAVLRPIKKLVSIMKLFYESGNSESQFTVVSSIRPKDLNCVECRKTIITIIQQMASIKYTDSDFMHLIGSIISASDHDLALDYLELLLSLIVITPSPLENHPVDALSLLMLTFSFNDECIMTRVFYILYVANQKKMLKSVSLSEHIFVILNQLTHDIVKEPVFTSLLSLLTNGFYELLPIVAWLAINLGKSSMVSLSNSLEAKKEYNTNSIWFFWPIILLFKAPTKESRANVLKFLIYTDKSSWESIFMTFDLVADILEESAEDIKSDFLEIIVDDLIAKETYEADELQTFFAMAKASIFYNNTNKGLKTLIAFAPYQYKSKGRSNSVFVSSPKANRRKSIIKFNSPPRLNIPEVSALNMWMTPSELTYLISTMKNKSKNSLFTLRIGPDGAWLDSILAEKCLNLFLKWRSPEFIGFDLTLCVFLIPYCYSDVKKHFMSLKLNAEIAEKYASILALVNEKCYDSSYPVMFKIPTKEHDISTFQALQNIGEIQPPTCVFGSTTQLEQVSKFFATIKEKSNYILEMLDSSEISLASQQLNKLVYTMQSTRKENEKKWIRLWRCLTIDGAPWSLLCPMESKSIPVKRDSSLCNYFCPSKLKRDWSATNQTNISLDIDEFDLFLSSIKKSKSRDSKEFPCHIVTIQQRQAADLVIGNSAIIIKKRDASIKEYPYESILYMLPRYSVNGENGFEIFFKGGKSKLITFRQNVTKSVFPVQKMRNLITPSLAALTKKWVNREMSNFEYLMNLNMLSGRSFNNIEQYPVMPWIIDDYESPKFDLFDSMFLRDLRKPISQEGQERLMRIIKSMQDSGNATNFSLPGSILRPEDIKSMLCRLNPFSNFDVESPASSIKEIFQKATNDDECFSEIPPEFYFLPEAFIKTRPESTIPDMKMPDWASNNPYAFVYYNRKALESDLVSATINQWIDLVWGIKQRGPGAISAFNKFNSAAYLPSSEKSNPLGFIPMQLFSEPHPPRCQREEKHYNIESPLTIQTNAANVIFTSFYKSDNHINVFMLDKSGKVNVHTLNFEQLRKYTIQKKRRNQLPKRKFSEGFPSEDSSMNQSAQNGLGAIKRSESSYYGKGLVRFSENLVKRDSSVTFNDLSDSGSSGMFELNKSPSYAFPSSISMTSIASTSKSSIVSSFSFERLQNASNVEFHSGHEEAHYVPAPHTSSVIPKFSKIDLAQKTGQFSLISNDTLAIVDAGLIKLFSIGQKHLMTLKSHSSDITTIFSNEVWTATASKGSVLTLYHTDDLTKYVFSIPLYRDMIQCTYISTSFNMAVSGTRDGFLFIVSLTRGTSGAAVDLKGARPYKVLVTHSWGFIVVYMTELERGTVHHVLSLYSPNGQFIKRRTIANGIVAWSSFSTQDGFDYVVCADEKGKLWSFEAFTLYLDESFSRSSTQVIGIMESVEEGGAIAVTKDGKILFIPNPI